MRNFAMAAALAMAFAAPAHADRTGHNPLDAGTPIGTAWATTAQFNALKAVGPDDVRFTTGESWQVRAEGDPRTLAHIRFIVREGQLTIGRKSSDRTRQRIILPAATVYVIAPGLRRATVGGSGSLEIDKLTGKKVSANVAGSGDLSVGSLDAETLDASLAGSGAMKLAGRTTSASLAIAGSGELKGGQFHVDTADTSIAGSGSMAFNSNGRVSASIVGSGSVSVRGSADCSKLSRIGSGTLRCGA